MNYIIVGLGNPGTEYENTRHNVGRMVLDLLVKKNDLDDFAFDKKTKSLITEGKIGKTKVILVKPETMMNKSGDSVKPLVKSVKAAASLIVVHDELDLPLGRVKISFNKSAGGHNGVKSVAKAVKTDEYIRVRVGISKSTASGKLKKPMGEKEVVDFILGQFKKPEMDELKKVLKTTTLAVEKILTDGKDVAMGEFNQG